MAGVFIKIYSNLIFNKIFCFFDFGYISHRQFDIYYLSPKGKSTIFFKIVNTVKVVYFDKG